MLPAIYGEDLFDEMMNFPFESEFFGKRNPLYGKNERNLMRTDIREDAKAYKIDVDLPGFKKEEIKVTLKDGYLSISAVKSFGRDGMDKQTGKYIRRERYEGSLTRSFYVGDGIEETDVRAKFENGILQLTLPKKEMRTIETRHNIAIE